MLYTFVMSFLIVIWFLSGTLKLFAMPSFIATVEKITGKRKWSTWAAYALPVLEIIFSLGLLLETYLPAVWMGSLIVLLLFLGVNLRSMLLKQELTCNCFGQAVPDQLGAGSLIKVALLTAMTGYLWIEAPGPGLWEGPETVYYLLVSMGLFCAYALIMAYSEFQKKWQPI